MRRSILLSSAIVLALLLPVVTTAAVVVDNSISVNVATSHANPVYLTQGPGYAIANSSGFIGLHGNNSQYTNLTVSINTIPGSGFVVMTNVLEVYNDSSSTSPVYIWINGSVPSGITIYYSTSLMTFSGSSVSGSILQSSNGPIHLTGKGADLYLSIMITDPAPGSFTLSLQYN